MIVVVSLSIVTFLAQPNSSSMRFSSLIPSSSLITFAPVSTAISSSMSLRRSPNPGAFTAATLSVPRNLFTTRVANASPGTSSAIIKIDHPTLRPFGPRVIFTVSASLFTPRRIAARECSPKVICFAIPVVCSPGLCRITLPDKVQHKNDNRSYKQKVNQAASDKATIKPNQPEQQQHCKNCPQHQSYLLIFKMFRLLCQTGLC